MKYKTTFTSGVVILIVAGAVALWIFFTPRSYPRWCFTPNKAMSDYLLSNSYYDDINEYPYCFYSEDSCDKFRKGLLATIADADYNEDDGGSERARAHDFFTVSHSGGCREYKPGESIQAPEGKPITPSEEQWVRSNNDY